MFETDDFDLVLSQLDYSDSLSASTTAYDNKNNQQFQQQTYFKRNLLSKDVATEFTKPDADAAINTSENGLKTRLNDLPTVLKSDTNVPNNLDDYNSIEVYNVFESNRENCESTRQSKKRMLGSLFDHQSKRKFPGPAGLLTGCLNHSLDDGLSRIEIFSQDVDCSQEHLHPSVFESKLWRSLLSDVRLWGLERIDSIGRIKQQELAGRLPSRKAHALTAFVEAVDRSAVNPLIILRDSSGTIKCTLHRDAWSVFSTYIMSEYTALALWKPTVFTTGTTFKKHYLNITLGNIIAIYCSKLNNNAQDDDSQQRQQLPSGYSKTVVDDFTAIRMDSCTHLENDASESIPAQINETHRNENEDHLQGLDSVSFLDEIF